MWFPLLVASLLGCRTTLAPTVDVPDENPVDEWGDLLEKAVDGDGYVDYDKIEKKRAVLDRYVAWVSRRGAIRGKGGPIAHAFWINTFNALAIWQVLERDRPRSVLNVKGWPKAGAGFFYWTAFEIDGAPPVSLWEIGHERVIEAQQDYRDFAVLNVAARSAPPLRDGLYTPDELKDQLSEQFSRWMEDDRGVRLEGDHAVFNPIFERYEDQFALFTHQADLCKVAAYHTAGKKQKRLEELSEEGCPHEFFDFDWRLNDHDAASEDGEGKRKHRKGRSSDHEGDEGDDVGDPADDGGEG